MAARAKALRCHSCRFRPIADIRRHRQIDVVVKERISIGSADLAAQRTARIHLSVLGTVFVAYLLVRIAWAPTGGFARFHLTDLLAGVALPSLCALVMRGWRNWERWSLSLRGKLALVGGATMIWEGLHPLLSTQATADPIDALCYLVGTLGQHAMVQTIFAAAKES
jgi:hypothetical protein